MRKKGLYLAVAVVILLAQLFVFTPRAYAADVGALITIADSEFVAYYASGPDAGDEVDDYNNIPRDAEISLVYRFEVDNTGAEIKASDFFTFGLPGALMAAASFGATDAELKDTDGHIIARLDIAPDGEVTITFAEAVDEESLTITQFMLTINGQFVPANLEGEDDLSFQLQTSGTVYNIVFEEEEEEPDPVAASIEKTGGYNPATNEITWTVSVDTGDAESIANVRVVDTLGSGQTYKAAYSSSGDPLSPTDKGGGVYEFDLGTVTGSTFFTVVTTPDEAAFPTTEGGETELENDVELYAGGHDDPVSSDDATATLKTDWIQKNGVFRSAEGVNYIDWTITLNNNHRIIPAGSAVTLTDTIPQYLTLDLGSVKRNGDTAAANGDTVGYNTTTRELTYTLNTDDDVTGVQTITFTTRVHDDYYKQQSITGFTNTGTLDIYDDEYSATSAKVDVGTSLLAKSGKGYNAATQLITWELEANRNGRAITNARIVDTLGANQVLFEGVITLRNGVSGTPVNLIKVNTLDEWEELESLAGTANHYYYDTAARVLTIDLGDLGAADHPFITFQTKVTNPLDYAANKTTTYRNTTAVLTGGGITTSTVTDTPQSVASQVIAKASVAYNYVTRKLSWRITVNQNNMDMPNAQVIDTIPAGQAYDEGSLLIDGAAPGGKLTVEGNTLTVKLGHITSQTIITFDTSVADLSVFLSTNGNVTFRNDAVLSSGISGAPTVSAWDTRVVNNKAIEKKLLIEYTKENGYIGWEVYINANQVPMQNATLADQLEDGLELDSESVKLYYWNQDADGNRSVGGEVLAGGYRFTYDFNERLFEIFLPDGAQGYYLTFNTDVLQPGQYSNTIGFSGSYSGTGSDDSGVRVGRSDIDFSIAAWSGSISLVKTDTHGAPLEGAEFELLDSLGIVKATLITDSDGRATFGPLKLRQYYIREKRAPLSFALDDREIEVTLSEETKIRTVHAQNDLLRASVALQKTDAQGVGLTGGRFGIYAAADTSFAAPLQIVSAEDGRVRFTGRLPGDYAIREIEAPIGFVPSDAVIPVSLVLDTAGNTLADVTIGHPFVNERVIGAVELCKVDGNGAPLAGARFGLYDRAGGLFAQAASDEHGLVLFAGVPSGLYTVRELAAPEGYVLSDFAIEVNVVTDGVTKLTPYKIANSSATLLPQAGSFFDGTVLLTLGALMILAGGVLLLRRPRRSSRTR